MCVRRKPPATMPEPPAASEGEPGAAVLTTVLERPLLSMQATRAIHFGNNKQRQRDRNRTTEGFAGYGLAPLIWCF